MSIPLGRLRQRLKVVFSRWFWAAIEGEGPRRRGGRSIEGEEEAIEGGGASIVLFILQWEEEAIAV